MAKHFDTLEALGISIPAQGKQHITDTITTASAAHAKSLTTMLETQTILKVQRSVHRALEIAQKAGPDGAKAVRVKGEPKRGPHLIQAAFYIPGDDGGDGSDDGWVDVDTDNPGDEICLCGASDGSGGSGDAYDASLDASIMAEDGGFTTPSGATIQMCTVYWSIIGSGAGAWGAGIAYLASVGSNVSVVIGGVLLDPPAIIALLAILVALAAYVAVMC